MANISFVKGVRTRFRNILEQLMKDGDVLLEIESSGIDLEDSIARVTKTLEKLKVYCDKVEIQSQNLVSCLKEGDEAEIEQILNDDCEMCSNAMDMYLKLKLFRDKLRGNIESEKKEMSETHETTEQIIQLQKDMQQLLAGQQELQQQERKKETQQSTVKLPKFELPSFDGDKTKYTEFWQSFNNAVHSNKKLSNIEKFNYLKSKLYGEAKSAITGLSLSNENYILAIESLKSRFGNSQDIIDIHYNKLINLPPATNSVLSLRNLIDSMGKHIRSLQVLGQNVDQNVFVSIIRSKLPEQVLLQLEMQNGPDVTWTVTSLSEKLRSYVVARERSSKGTNVHSVENPNKGAIPKRNSMFQSNSSAQALTANKVRGQAGELKCMYCSSKHWSDECSKYKSVAERKTKLKGHCFKCLRKGHLFKDCRSQRVCVHCKKVNAHHRSLCPEKFGSSSSVAHVANEVVQELDIKNEANLVSTNEIVLMQTVLTNVFNAQSNATEKVRILLDSGSHRSYISESLAQRLSLKSEGEEDIYLVTFGSQKAKKVTTKCAKIKVQLKNGTKTDISVNIVPVISGTFHRKDVKDLSAEHIQNIINSVDLADEIPIENETTSVEILLGNDYYLDFILGQKIELQEGLYLLASKFGWILSGRTTENHENTEEPTLFVQSHGTTLNESNCIPETDSCLPIKPDIEDFWNLESIGIVDKPDKADDACAMERFRDTLKFENGRYQVTWPWKQEDPDLPTNKELAIGRLTSTVNRLCRKPDMLQKYDNVINDQLQKGVVEKIEESKPDGLVHYIPHHAVVTPAKTTTKLRVVYDASAKTKRENKSLNECLYRGPVMLNDLCGLLLRFRLYPIALIADIEKAFLQMGLQTDQRDVTRFFWLKNVENPTVSSDNIEEYRFARVPFGVISSPFLLGATVEAHLDKYDDYVAQKIKNDIYVDNLITGVNSVKEAQLFYGTAKDIFNEASMNLREWMTNNPDANNIFAPADKSDAQRTKVLGYEWDLKADTMSLKHIARPRNISNTKRNVLKHLASAYDPLGLLSPVILQGKIFLQELWSKKLDWDDELNDEDLQKWSHVEESLNVISQCQVPRFIGIEHANAPENRLLCFCDASKSAYAAVVYLHQTTDTKTVTNLVFSKTRLAPVKKMSIPRLELLAVLIGVRCLEFVKTQLKLPIIQSHLWTDSKAVIHWIKSDKQLPLFIRNRVVEIRNHSNVSIGYVPSKENPADIASRGADMTKLCEKTLWWCGPMWIATDHSEWPCFEAPVEDKLEDSQVNSFAMTSTKLTSLEEVTGELGETKASMSPFEIDSNKFSSLTKLLRVTALVLRFIRKIRRKGTASLHLTSEEIKAAEVMWIKSVQRCHFPEITHSDHQKKPTIQRQLGVYKDSSGVLRCRGRLENAELCENARLPILLPKHHKYTRLVIESVHRKALHSGVSQTLSSVRERFWIPHGRAMVKSVIKSCPVCRRYEGGPYKLPPMCALPKSRVTEATPFTRVGLDYLGPLYIKDPETKTEKKVWICLFTCLVTRAIHLELVCDMSTSEFILCFRRFVSQRGSPSEIISDNAMQFRTASTLLEELWSNIHKSDDVWSYLSNTGIQWIFNVELSPWMGGFYERLVGLVKRALKKTLGRRLLTLTQMQTVLKEIESVVNSRPLVYVGDDINSHIPITPTHFLSLNPGTGGLQMNADNDEDYQPSESTSKAVVNMWKKGMKLLDLFWKAWRDDYLMSLRERTQTTVKTGRIQSDSEPKVGDVVLVKDTCSRGNWKFGRITKLKKSRDTLIRSASIMLPSGKEIKRPLNLLYPLEVSGQAESLKGSEDNIVPERRVKQPRKAAFDAKTKIKDIFGHDLA